MLKFLVLALSMSVSSFAQAVDFDPVSTVIVVPDQDKAVSAPTQVLFAVYHDKNTSSSSPASLGSFTISNSNLPSGINVTKVLDACVNTANHSPHCHTYFQIPVSGIKGSYPNGETFSFDLSWANSSSSVNVSVKIIEAPPVVNFYFSEADKDYKDQYGQLASFTTVATDITVRNSGNYAATPEIALIRNPSGMTINTASCHSGPVGRYERTSCLIRINVPAIKNLDDYNEFTVSHNGVVQDTYRVTVTGYRTVKVTAVGSNGNLYRTTPNIYGTGFTAQTFGYAPGANFTSYNVTGSKMSVSELIGFTNTHQISSDSGATFSSITVPGGPMSTLSVSGSDVMAVTYNMNFFEPGFYVTKPHSVQISHDSGGTFSALTLPSTLTRPVSGSIEGSKIMLLSMQPLKVALSTDSGVNFSQLTLPVGSSSVLKVMMKGNQIFLHGVKDAAGELLGSFLSSDLGVSFQPLTLPSGTIQQVGLDDYYVYFNVSTGTANTLYFKRSFMINYKTSSVSGVPLIKHFTLESALP